MIDSQDIKYKSRLLQDKKLPENFWTINISKMIDSQPVKIHKKSIVTKNFRIIFEQQFFFKNDRFTMHKNTSNIFLQEQKILENFWVTFFLKND